MTATATARPMTGPAATPVAQVTCPDLCRCEPTAAELAAAAAEVPVLLGEYAVFHARVQTWAAIQGLYADRACYEALGADGDFAAATVDAAIEDAFDALGHLATNS